MLLRISLTLLLLCQPLATEICLWYERGGFCQAAYADEDAQAAEGDCGSRCCCIDDPSDPSSMIAPVCPIGKPAGQDCPDRCCEICGVFPTAVLPKGVTLKSVWLEPAVACGHALADGMSSNRTPAINTPFDIPASSPERRATLCIWLK